MIAESNPDFHFRSRTDFLNGRGHALTICIRDCLRLFGAGPECHRYLSETVLEGSAGRDQLTKCNRCLCHGVVSNLFKGLRHSFVSGTAQLFKSDAGGQPSFSGLWLAVGPLRNVRGDSF